MPKVYVYKVVFEGVIETALNEDTGRMETKEDLRQLVTDSFKPDLMAGVGEPVITITLTRKD